MAAPEDDIQQSPQVQVQSQDQNQNQNQGQVLQQNHHHHHHLSGGGVGLIEARWDACYDIALRRFFYSSLAGAASGLLLFRSPVTRWAAVAFGAGVGLGSAYTDCSHIMVGALPKWPLPSSIPPNSHTGPEES